MIEEIIRRYAAGQSIRDIAWALSTSRARILHVLKAAGIPRNRRPKHTTPFGRLTDPVPKPWPR